MLLKGLHCIRIKHNLSMYSYLQGPVGRAFELTTRNLFQNFDEVYGKFSKISNTFLFLSSNKTWCFRAGINKMLVSIANSEDPDQTASSEAV